MVRIRVYQWGKQVQVFDCAPGEWEETPVSLKIMNENPVTVFPFYNVEKYTMEVL